MTPPTVTDVKTADEAVGTTVADAPEADLVDLKAELFNHQREEHLEWTFANEQVQQPLIQRLAEVNKELWLVLSMLILAAALNWMITAHQVVLGFYALPTLFSAYFYGRRHAVLTAFASVGTVILLASVNPTLLANANSVGSGANGRWYDLLAWGGTLMITAYAMGTLHERHQVKVQELQETYRGLLMILRQFIAKDKYTENHSYRVSVYAAKIAARMGFSAQRIEDVRAASLLHDIGKLDVSRKLLYKAEAITRDEMKQLGLHVPKGGNMLDPVGGPLRRILPIILAHHEKYDGSGEQKLQGDQIPIEARVVSVADVFDALTSDRPYRKAMSPYEARDVIVKGSGREFDPAVVGAFLTEMKRGGMEVPEIYL